MRRGIRFERKHDLLPLMTLCADTDDDFNELADDLQRLERYAVAIRYPGTSASVEFTESAFDTAERIRIFIRKKLEIK